MGLRARLNLGDCWIPLAELVIVAGLFWSVVCGDAASDIVGNVCLRGRTLVDACRIRKQTESQLANAPRSWATIYDDQDTRNIASELMTAHRVEAGRFQDEEMG